MQYRLPAMAALIALSACGGGTDSKDKIADRVEENADNRAEAMEQASQSMANALQQNIVEQQADQVRRAGEERADAIRNSQLEVNQLNAQQKNKLVKGQ